jgi:hypothetical protein
MTGLPQGFVLDETPAIALNEGVRGASVGSREAATRETQTLQGPALRQLLIDLAQSQVFNRAIPTGRFAANVNMAAGQLPSGWQPGNVADFQSFGGLRQGMVRPILSLTSPGGQPSSRELDTPKEQELALMSIPGPEKERAANEFLIDRVARSALDRVAFNAFHSRWRSLFGSSYAKDKRGRAASEAWSEYVQSPDYARTVTRQFTGKVNDAIARRASKPVSEMSDAELRRMAGLQ